MPCSWCKTLLLVDWRTAGGMPHIYSEGASPPSCPLVFITGTKAWALEALKTWVEQ